MTILDDIMATKRREVAEMKSTLSTGALEERIKRRGPTRSARAAFLSTPPKGVQSRILSEVKEASPSKGILRKDLDGIALAREYETAGATAISVLTDPTYFRGSFERLEQIRPHVNTPILAKEFIFDPWQILRSRAAGADFVLLIVAALSARELQELIAFAHGLHLETLVEVHDRQELHVALETSADLIGVNNRNLKTFETSLETSLELIDECPEDRVAISESGIRTRADIALLETAGFHGFLIGESLVCSPQPGKTLQRLAGGLS